MECVIDTNVLVYEMVENSDFHEKAEELFDSMNRCIIPTTVIEEFVRVLGNMDVKEVIIYERLEELLNTTKIEIIPISHSNMSEATKSILKHKLSFRRFNDELILSVAKSEKMPLFTFDRKLISRCNDEGVKSLI